MFHTIFSAMGFLIWLIIIAGIVGFLKKSGLSFHKSISNRFLGGVCGGIGETMGVDPTLIRIIWIFLIGIGGTGLMAYIIACLVLPEGY